MELNKLQKEVDDYINSFEEGYFPPLSNLARLFEEAGELARELNHRFGPKKKKDSENQSDGTAEEMGDILFTLLVLANQLDIDMNDSFKSVLEKYRRRDTERWTLRHNQGET